MSVLNGQSLRVIVDGSRLVDDVTLALEPGTLTGLIGPNGAGKTTLIRTLLGLAPLAHGTVQVGGRDLLALSPRERARAVAYLAQDRTIYWPLTVEALVGLGRLPYRAALRTPPEDAHAIQAAIERTGIGALAKRPVTTLSGGERARVLLATALAVGAPVLLVDEPVAALDPAHQFAVMELLTAEARRGVAVLVVLHDLPLAASTCQRLVLMDQGRIIADGTPTSVLTEEHLANVYGVRARGPLGLTPLAPLDRPAAATIARGGGLG